jgi:hypothetical protein
MTSFRQFEANRRNAQRSTGPRTEEGKRRSRLNAVRHGLTAETVICSLEDAEDYKAFEAAVIADYDGQTAVERELVLRLASLLWRIRRATAIETQVFEMQAEALWGRQDGVNDTTEPNRSSLCSVHHLPKPTLYDALAQPVEPLRGSLVAANCTDAAYHPVCVATIVSAVSTDLTLVTQRLAKQGGPVAPALMPAKLTDFTFPMILQIFFGIS